MKEAWDRFAHHTSTGAGGSLLQRQLAPAQAQSLPAGDGGHKNDSQWLGQAGARATGRRQRPDGKQGSGDAAMEAAMQPRFDTAGRRRRQAAGAARPPRSRR